MHTVHPVRMESSPSVSHTNMMMDDRISASKTRARKRWIIRTGLLLIITFVLLFVVVTWRRDQMNVEISLRTLDEPMAALQAKINELGRLPKYVPGFESAYYATDAERHFAMSSAEPTIIYVTPKTELILHQDGRGVIIYQQGKLIPKWMSSSEFFSAWNHQQQSMKKFEKERFSKPPVIP